MSNGLINELIAVIPGQTTTTIRMYLQFIVDVNAQRTLKSDGSVFFNRIYNEIKDRSYCLGYTIKYNLMPTSGLPEGAVNKNFLLMRDPARRNPFQPYPTGVTPPVEPLFKEEKDAFGNPLTAQDPPAYQDPPALPIIRFYMGDGESLNRDIVGEGGDPVINEADAIARLNYNSTHNFREVIPGYEFFYSTRTSFFSRELRAGYLFTDSQDPFEVVFMHELGHILGLSDRYIEAVDDAFPSHPFKYVGQAVRRNPPLSKNHINYVLNGGTTGPDNDPDYDPQQNLMSSRSYKLSGYQKDIIQNRKIEATYLKDDVMVLAFRHPECKRTSINVFPGPCPITETRYHPTSVSVDSKTKLDKVTFETSPTAPPVPHNAVFKQGTAVVPMRYQYDDSGDVQKKKANKGILNSLYLNDGLHSEALELILRFFNYKST